ncbi:hypothetical protein [Nocardia sp. NRRL S-836]|uniref:WXG100-like domain-containing protein n=1 Tax=Nocardia sp. NRRL S-836 TaxID=1519492 RepID=UPI0006AE21E3|nr:hypothetical protein [Nocardia sp. NRRL S-836]KOV87236.1 hypothetical protein ADL03_07820 [Nocardia sp. NRRL S-836]
MAMPEPHDDFGFWESVKDKSIDTLWPPDNEYVAWALAEAWNEAAAVMETAAKAWETAGTRLPSAWFDIAGVQFTSAVNSMPPNYTNLAANMKLLADGVKSYGDQLHEARISILWELAVNIGLFVALSWIPGGGFLAAALSRAVAGRLTAMITGMAGRIAAGFAKLGVEIVKESFDEAFNNTATQLTSILVGSRKEFKLGELGQATFTGGIGGVLGEGLGKAMKLGNTAVRKALPSLPTAPTSGLARTLNVGLSSGLNNAVTSPSAGYIAEHWGNYGALADLSGYGKAISDGGIAAGLAGAPRSMAIDLVQQRNPGHAAQADAWADRLVGTPAPPDGGPPGDGGGPPGDGELSGGPGTAPSAQTDPATAPQQRYSPDGAPVADGTTTDNRSVSEHPSETERSTTPPGGRGIDVDTGGRTTHQGPLRSESPIADQHPGEQDRRAAPAEQQKTSAPEHGPVEQTPATASPAEAVDATGTADAAAPADTTETAGTTQDLNAPAPAEPGPADPAQDAPTQEAPVQGTPVQGTPVQGTPVRGGPAQGTPAPTRAAPVHSSSGPETTTKAPPKSEPPKSEPPKRAEETETAEPAQDESSPIQAQETTAASPQVNATPAGAVLAATAATPPPAAPRQENKPRAAPTHTKVTTAPSATANPAPVGDTGETTGIESGRLPAPQAGPQSLGAFTKGLSRDSSGRITHIGGVPVRQKLRELAHERAKLYDDLRRQPGTALGRDRTGGVVALVVDLTTGEVFESTNGTNPSVVLKKFVPSIRARIMAMFHHPDGFGGNTVNGLSTGKRRFKGLDSPFRHAEVRAADAALTKNPHAELADLAADVVWTGAKGKKPLAPAAFCPNCSEILHDVRSNGGKRVYHPVEGTVDGPTGWEAGGQRDDPPPAPPHTADEGRGPSDNSPEVSPPTPRLRAADDTAPARSPRTYPVGPVPHSRFHADPTALPNRPDALVRALQAMGQVQEDAGVAGVRRLRGHRFLVTRTDGSTFVVKVVAGETNGTNPAEAVVPVHGTPTIRVSQQAGAPIIARAVANALAQVSERLAGNEVAADRLGADRHPGSHTDLSAADHGRQAELRALAREHEEVARVRFLRRRRIAAEVLALVEHLGLHADDPAGPQRQALLDPAVRAILAKHAGPGARRPSWAGEPTGTPRGKAFLAHLVTEAMPGVGGAAALLGAGHPTLALGVGAITVSTSVTSTLAKRWYDSRERALVDEGHEKLAAQRAHDAAQRRKRLLDPLWARARSTGIDVSDTGPAEPAPTGERPADHQSLGARVVGKSLSSAAGGVAAGVSMLGGLGFTYAAAYLAVAGAAALAGPHLEKVLRSRTTRREWAKFDEVAKELAAEAADYDNAFAAKLSALLDRVDRLAGSAPTGTAPTTQSSSTTESHDAGLHHFAANAVPNAVGDLARGGAAALDALRFGESAANALLNGGVRAVLGMAIAAFLDRKSLRSEQQELIDQFEFDQAAELDEHVALERAVLDALLAEADGRLTAAEAAQQVRDRLPSRRQDRSGRPTGYGSRQGTGKANIKRAGATTAAIAGSAWVFDQGLLPVVVGATASAMLVASVPFKYLFRRAEVLAADERTNAERAREQTAEAAETVALHEFLQRFMAREVQAAVTGQVDPLPAAPRVPRTLDRSDPRYPGHIEALTAHEREKMLREPRPWSLLGARLAALQRIDRMAVRVREFAAHDHRTGRSAPVVRARNDLAALWSAYHELVQDGTPMPTDHELHVATRLRAGSDAAENVLPQRLQQILDESTVTPAGRAFYQAGDEMLADADQVPPKPGSYTVDVHGNATSVRIGTERLTADDLAAIIEADPNWQGQPIRLLSCNTGHDDNGFAQQLADRLGVPVTAPSDYAGTFADGRPFVATARADESGRLVPKIPPDGNWRTFTPTPVTLDKPVTELPARIENTYTPGPVAHPSAEPPVIGVSELPPPQVGAHRIGIFATGLTRNEAGLITHVLGVPVREVLRELTVERAKLYWSPDNAQLRKDLKDRYRDLVRELQTPAGRGLEREEIRHEMKILLKKIDELDQLEKALPKKATGACLALQLDLVTGEVFEATNGREGAKIIWHKFQAEIKLRIESIRRRPHGYPGPEYRGHPPTERRQFPGYDSPFRHAEVRAADAALAARPDALLSDLAADVVFLKAGYPQAPFCPNCSAILHDVRSNVPKFHYNPETDRSAQGHTDGWEGHTDHSPRLRDAPDGPPAKPDLRPNLHLPDHEEIRFGEMRPLYTGAERLWPDELADTVTSSPEWTEDPIRLTVHDGSLDTEFLQRFTDLVGVPVWVPDRAVVEAFLTCSSGTLEIAHGHAPPPDGRWRTIHPRNKETR